MFETMSATTSVMQTAWCLQAGSNMSAQVSTTLNDIMSIIHTYNLHMHFYGYVRFILAKLLAP